MPGWYDIRDLESDRSSIREDLEGVEASTKVLESLIEIEARSLESAGGKSRLMIGGFSQGGAIALNAILRAKEKLSGCAALSTYIPGNILHTLKKLLGRKMREKTSCWEI